MVTSLFRDRDDLKELEECVRLYDEASGSKFNEEKTGAMPFGSLTNTSKPEWVKMFWTNKPETLLGALVGTNLENVQEFEILKQAAFGVPAPSLPPPSQLQTNSTKAKCVTLLQPAFLNRFPG